MVVKQVAYRFIILLKIVLIFVRIKWTNNESFQKENFIAQKIC